MECVCPELGGTEAGVELGLIICIQSREIIFNPFFFSVQFSIAIRSQNDHYWAPLVISFMDWCQLQLWE